MSTNPTDAMRARSRTIANTTIQQVNGGFLVTGQIQFVDLETNGVLGEQNDRFVASDIDRAYGAAKNWTLYGAFDAPVQGTPVVQPSATLAPLSQI